VHALVQIGASTIIGIDINPGKFELAKEMGATACVNSQDHPDKDIKDVIIGMSPSG